jgi:uncharacterized OB-fold protein
LGQTQRQVPIADGLFTGPADAPQLIGSRCTRCREVSFPKQSSCPACTGDSTEQVLLARRGTLWTWTIQRFPPPPPYIGDAQRFEPYGVGYVELPEGVRVESRLTTADPEALAIGMEMELVLEKFVDGPDGAARMTFAFAPVARAGR